MSRVTVRKYLVAETFPEWSSHPEPYEAHLEARWREGCRNARQLGREIRAQGYSGPAKQVHRWVQPPREEPARNTPHAHRHPQPAAAQTARSRFSSARRLW